MKFKLHLKNFAIALSGCAFFSYSLTRKLSSLLFDTSLFYSILSDKPCRGKNFITFQLLFPSQFFKFIIFSRPNLCRVFLEILKLLSRDLKRFLKNNKKFGQVMRSWGKNLVTSCRILLLWLNSFSPIR